MIVSRIVDGMLIKSFVEAKHLAGRHAQTSHAGLGNSLGKIGGNLLNFAARNPVQAITAVSSIAVTATALAAAASSILRRLEVAGNSAVNKRTADKVKKVIEHQVRIDKLAKMFSAAYSDNEACAAWVKIAQDHSKKVNEVFHSKNLRREDVAAYARESEKVLLDGLNLNLHVTMGVKSSVKKSEGNSPSAANPGLGIHALSLSPGSAANVPMQGEPLSAEYPQPFTEASLKKKKKKRRSIEIVP